MTFNLAIFASFIILAALIVIGLVMAKLYCRATKEMAFVRTGFGGQSVIMNGGALVFPILHEIIQVNMNTLRLEVKRADSQALITRDRMRVDVQAEFYVRVKPISNAIADAAQTLGRRTMNPQSLKELIEGKFVDALRSVAAEMAMEELHELRAEFVQKVQTVVSEDLLKNGLELETVSLTGLDQTSREYFNPDNAFDAQGLTKLTEQIEARRKQRNDIEQDTEVQIKLKNLEAEKKKLDVLREEEYAKLAQEREIEVRKASQSMEIAKERADKEREAKEAEIAAKQKVDEAQISMQKAIQEQTIAKDEAIKERDIDKMKAIELAEQVKAIAIAEKSKEQSQAQKEANEAKAQAVSAEEKVVTSREAEIADRQKTIELIEARKIAEREAISVTVKAEAKRKAAEDEAQAIQTIAEADAQKMKIEAQGLEEKYKVEAEGKKALHEADNTLSEDLIALKIKTLLIENLPEILEQSVKPMENIDGIKILQVAGLNGDTSGAISSNGHTGVNLADEVVNSALRYRAQAPLVDSLLQEIGLDGSHINGLTNSLTASVSKSDVVDNQTPSRSSNKQTKKTSAESMNSSES